MGIVKVDQILPNSILVVDDSKKTVMLHVKYAQTACPGIVVQTAYDGKTAWEFFKENPVAVVMLDIEMPGLNGVEVAEKIFRLSPSTGIIVFSVNLTHNVMLKFASIDVDFAKKPASEFDVAVKVRSALRAFDKDRELEQMKLCAKITVDINAKQFPLHLIKFLQDLVGDPKASAKIEFFRKAMDHDSNGDGLNNELTRGPQGRQKREIFRKIDQLDSEAFAFIQKLFGSSNYLEKIDLCQRVLNPPSSQIQRAIVDCLYPENLIK